MPDPLKEDGVPRDEDLDADSNLSAMRVPVQAVVESRRLVLVLSAVPVIHSPASPVCQTSSVDVDRVAGVKYMRDYYVQARARRMEAKALTKIAP